MAFEAARTQEVPKSVVATRGATVAGADEIMTVEEVAQALRCSKAHVYKAILGRVTIYFADQP